MPGHGVQGEIGGKAAFGGNAALMQEKNLLTGQMKQAGEALANEGKTPLYFALGGRLLGIVAVADVVKPDSAEARAMTATSGRRCLELSTSCGPLGSLERMLLTSSIWRSTMCFLTWKVKATPHGRLWFQLAASALRTKDTDLQSWPTPTAMDAAGLARHLRKDATSTRSLLLCQKVAYLAGGGVLEI